MNLTDEIKDFLNSDSIFKDFGDKKLVKMPLKFNNGYNIFIADFNRISVDNMSYCFSVNNENEIIYIQYPVGKYLLDEQKDLIYENYDSEEAEKINAKYDKLLNDLYENIKKELTKRQPEYDKEYDYKSYKQNAIELYAINDKKNEIKVYSQYTTLNLDLISAYNTSNFEDYCKTLITEKIENLYKDSYFSIKALEEYKKEIAANPFLLKETKIREILLNDDYKSFRLYYTLPSGGQREFIFKKDLKKYEGVNKQIIEKSQLYNIPILAIDKIMFRKTILFDKKDYDVPEYDNEKLALEFAKCRPETMVEEIIPYFNMEPEVMKYIFEVDHDLFKRFDEDLQKDPDFLLDLLENHNVDYSRRNSWYFKRYNKILERIPDDCYKDKDFVDKLVEIFKKDNARGEEATIESEVICRQFLKDVDYSSLSEQNILDLLDRYQANKILETLIEKDASCITEKIIECAIRNNGNNKFSHMSYSAMNKITDTKTLTSLFTTNLLAEYICGLNDCILDDRDFVINLLKEKNAKPFNDYSRDPTIKISKVFDKYKNDKNVLYLMIPYVAYTSEAEKILNELGELNDKDAIYDYASLCVNFLGLLKSGADYELYLEAETLEIDSMSINIRYPYWSGDEEYEFKFHTYNGEIILGKGVDARNIEGWSVSIEDNHGHAYRFDSKYNEIALKNIKNFIEKEMGLDFKKLQPSYQNFKKMFINGKTEEEIKNFHFPPLPKEEIEK